MSKTIIVYIHLYNNELLSGGFSGRGINVSTFLFVWEFPIGMRLNEFDVNLLTFMIIVFVCLLICLLPKYTTITHQVPSFLYLHTIYISRAES